MKNNFKASKRYNAETEFVLLLLPSLYQCLDRL